MKKVLLLLVVLLITPMLFCEDDWDPGKHWKETLKYLNEEIEDLKEWSNDENSEKILENINSQISLKEEMVDKVNKVLEMEKKDYESLELEFRLLRSKENILHSKVKLIELEEREELSDTDKSEIELLTSLLDIKEEMLELQAEEVEIEKQLRGMRKQKKIEELKKELEKLQE